MDLLIKRALVVDGLGGQPYLADVGVQAGRITAIGELTADAAVVLDADGLVLTPGFIDMHSHTDLEYLKPTPPLAKIFQGITTELLGQDGLGVAPVTADSVHHLAGLTAGLLGGLPVSQWSWHSFSEYLEALESRSLPNNAAVLVSHGPLRLLTVGTEQRQATKDELLQMRALVDEAMQSGAFGFSTGLIYPPCSYGDTEELIQLNERVAAHQGIFVVHQRDEGHGLLRSFAEVVQVARVTGVHLHISHLQAYGQVNWPLLQPLLQQVDRLAEQGVAITWDRYPYLSGCTVLTAVLPIWALADGPAALVEHLGDKAYRQRIKQEYTKGLDIWNNRQISVGWEKIIISAVASADNSWMQGHDCAFLARQQGKDPIDFVLDLLVAENLAVTMISFYGSEAVLEQVLLHQQATVGSDGIYGGRPHPRLYGTYPKFIRDFVVKSQRLTLQQAIAKTTAFPASILGLADRGVIKPGYFADLLLFNLEELADTATYDHPERFPTGIWHVFVNGRAVIQAGQSTGCLPGKVLRKN